MAQPPQKKPPPPGRAREDSGLDDYFDEFFRNAEPPQLDEASEPGQQRQWISDQLMWETTLGMREDETINRVITPGEDEGAAQAAAPQSAAARKPLSERDRQLLRTQVTQPQFKPPAQRPKTPPAPREMRPSQPPRGQPNRQNAQTPPRATPTQNVSKASAGATAATSRAPVKPVQPSNRAANKATTHATTSTTSNAIPRRPQPAKPAAIDGASRNTSTGQAQPRGNATGTASRAHPALTPAAPKLPPPKPIPQTPQQHKPAPPVTREADHGMGTHIDFDVDDDVSREKYFKLGKQVVAAFSIAIVSFISGYYIGGIHDTETTVAQTDYASEQPKTAPTSREKTSRPAPKKPAPQKAKPAPVAQPAERNLATTSAAGDIENNAPQATATVFQGKEIDIEQFDQSVDSTSATPASPELNRELNSELNSEYGNTRTTGLAEAPGTANFLPSPQGDSSAALSTPAASPAATAMAKSARTSTTTTTATTTRDPTATAAVAPESASINVQNLMDSSLQAFQNKQWQTLIDLSNKILAQDPGVVTALTNRAAANTELGAYTQALADCNLAIKIEPNNPLAINNRGYVYEKMGDINNAITDYQTACTLGVELSCKEAQRLTSNPAK